jgi:formamidopyrimidine-DNA glycosylase
VVPVDGVAAPWSGRGVDRHAGLLQRPQIALDGADADLEASGHLPSGSGPRCDRPQLVDQSVEAIGAVHPPSMLPRETSWCRLYAAAVPEMLEVETYRRQAEVVVGRTVDRVDTPDAWYVKRTSPDEVVAAVSRRTIDGVRRIGKLLVLDLDDDTRLGLRFGMSGRLLVDGAAAIDRLQYASGRNNPAWDRFGLHFTDGSDLRIRDPRRLGGVELEPDEGRLGVDAQRARLRDVEAAVRGSRAPLKARLLDQTRIAGIGNLLADEILFRAGLDPARPAGGLAPAELRRLHGAIGRVIADLTARGGSHTGDARQAMALDGLCPRDGAALQVRRIGGRTTVSCPVHQV